MSEKEMLYRLYSVYDAVAEEFGPVFTAKNDGVALRNYKNLCETSKVNPVDYQLYHLATINTTNGDIVASKYMLGQYDETDVIAKN